MAAEQDSYTLQTPNPSISHDTDLLLYTSHPDSISIHLLILTLQYTSLPENSPIHLPSSHFHKPQSSQHSHSPPILSVNFCESSLNTILPCTCQQLGAKVRDVTGG